MLAGRVNNKRCSQANRADNAGRGDSYRDRQGRWIMSTTTLVFIGIYSGAKWPESRWFVAYIYNLTPCIT